MKQQVSATLVVFWQDRGRSFGHEALEAACAPESRSASGIKALLSDIVNCENSKTTQLIIGIEES